MPRVLLLIDYQRDFLEPAGRLTVGAGRADRLLDATDRLIRAASASDAVPAFAANAFPRWDLFGNLSRNWSALAGSPGAQLHERLRHHPFPLFPKREGNALSNPELAPFVRARGAGELVLAGVFSEYCVCRTCAAALKLGFTVRAVADAIESDSDRQREKGLASMRALGAAVETLEEFERSLRPPA